MTESKKCTKCLINFPATLDYFYKGKIMLRSRCKKCCSKQVMDNPNHKVASFEYYYNNLEKMQGYAMKKYVKNKTGVALCC